MSTTYLQSVPPTGLTPIQRQEWQRRHRIAENTIEIQVMGGTLPDNETLHCFQRYVNGELTLNDAMERVRQQMRQEREMLDAYIQRRNII
jgi:hypothetical protein